MLLWFCLISTLSCENYDDKNNQFTLMDNDVIGIDFINDLQYDQEFNVYKYRNFYNGGGVGIGDINNDNLPDIYFTSNQGSNKLFLNKGNFRFDDITERSKVAGGKAWSTGVTIVDINADGYLDIYVCNSGDIAGDNKENELFINNGDLTFTESAEQFGLNDKGFSTHASFFDFDKDGDLDVYILNNSYQAIGSFNLRKNERPNRDLLGGDKLMENRNGFFVDVSAEAGIYGSVIGFGLGVTIGDVNNDGWEDIFVSNDFFERDYLYINQRDGTFKEDLTSEMKSISGASMGADMADINNDGYNDIFVTEMLPSDYGRLKTVTTFEDWNKYQYNVKNGYHHQFTRNTLHYNNGNSTFSEISRLSGVSASDWSWGALFFDMDNDGLKDLFIANGIYRDLTNLDYLEYIANEQVMKSIVSEDKVDYSKLIDTIPSNMIPNHAYRNMGSARFERYKYSGLDDLSFSNGAAYGDLDNDGDLDLVVNNVNMPAFVYRNNNLPEDGNFIKIKLKGENKNINAIGAKVLVIADDVTLSYEVHPTRGFQSSVDIHPLIGVGDADIINVKVIWPQGLVSVRDSVKTNQTIFFDIQYASKDTSVAIRSNEVFKNRGAALSYIHEENRYVDFNQERLVSHMRSNEGPIVAIGDVNGDGLEDIIIPGAKGFTTRLFVGREKGYVEVSDFAKETLDHFTEAESVQAMFFDADTDGDLDVYIANGGVELSKYSEFLYDIILFNDGNGYFERGEQLLPSVDHKISTGAVASSDFDGDGDMDCLLANALKLENLEHLVLDLFWQIMARALLQM